MPATVFFGAVLFLILIGGMVMAIVPQADFVAVALAALLFLVSVFSVIGMFIAGTVGLCNRRWGSGFLNVFFAIIFLGAPFFLPYFIGGPDDFGKNIKVPKDMVVSSVAERLPTGFLPTETDALGEAIDLYLKDHSPASVASELTFNVGGAFLDQFSGPQRKLLLRHMATSAVWFLTRDTFQDFYRKSNGNLYAYRLFRPNDALGCKEAGQKIFLNQHGIPKFGYIPAAYSYIGVAPDGIVNHDYAWKNIVQRKAAAGSVLTLETGKAAYLAIRGNGALLEVNEKSPVGKSLMPMLFKAINDEFQAVLTSSQAKYRGFDPALMPAASVKRGNAQLVVTGDWHSYNVYVYANPGESGYVYLKIFEATGNRALSGYSKEPWRTMKYMGWSSDSAEQFYYHTQVIIGEGDPVIFYPARFELWFVPDSGKSERKIIEKIYSISGYSR